MDIYINGISSISPQKTFQADSFLSDIEDYNQPYLEVLKPNYKEFIQAKLLRRMSKIIRMGVTSGNKALQEAGVQNPDAIITGTGLGCIVDTEKFLNAMIDNQEQYLTPTSFIQSTHNTVSAQLAVMLGCNNYNFTYVHSGVSFEHSLIDALMHFEEGTMQDILVGGIDEITAENYETKKHSSVWKKEPVKMSELYQNKSQGCIPGESATFASLSTKRSDNSYAKLIDTHALSRGNEQFINQSLEAFLDKHHLTTEDIDLVLVGMNGDEAYDQRYSNLIDANFKNKHIVGYKNICGEHDSASAFAFWVASMIAKRQEIPPIIQIEKGDAKNIKNILIYQYDFMHDNNHGFTLIQSL